MLESNQLLIAITFIIIFLAFLCVIIVVFVIKSRGKILSKELEKRDLKIKYQNDILFKIIEAQENERQRIARDLHDDISSKLIAVSLNLQLLKSSKTKDEDKLDIVNNVFDITAKTIESSRKIAHHLYPPVLEKFGLTEALKELVLDFNKTNKIKINLAIDGKFHDEVSNYQLQIFRIIQELINNTIKHGKASKIDIKFTLNKNTNSCLYKDNGVGIDSSKINETKGLGFSNIENRIQNINGTFTIESEINKGFLFNFTF